MFTREMAMFQRFGTLLKQQGIDLDSVPDDDN